MAEINLYTILLVNEDASQEDIKKAFRSLALIAHPDKGGKASDMQLLVECYEILGNPTKRKCYDLERAKEREEMLQYERQMQEEREREIRREEEERLRQWLEIQRKRQESARKQQEQPHQKSNSFNFETFDDLLKSMAGEPNKFFYITNTGKCYHKNQNCPGLRAANKKIPMPPSEIKDKSLKPCRLCVE